MRWLTTAGEGSFLPLPSWFYGGTGQMEQRRHAAGKGDAPRPVDYKKWSENWDRIFGKKKPKPKKPKK